jgi:ABC-type molybdate transport system permease subunit
MPRRNHSRARLLVRSLSATVVIVLSLALILLSCSYKVSGYYLIVLLGRHGLIGDLRGTWVIIVSWIGSIISFDAIPRA